jgi:ATP-dependent exoDNAse (exonuclease V) beta subunit
VSSIFEPYKTFNKEGQSFRMALKRIDEPWYKELSKKHGYLSEKIAQTMLGVYTRDEIDRVQAEIIAEWELAGKESSEAGTLFHTTQEQADIRAGGRINPWTGNFLPYIDIRLPGFDNNSPEFLSDLVDGYYPELLMFDEDYLLGGQGDMVFIENRNAYVDDWKTDKSIDTKSFYTRRYGFSYLKAPLDHIYDSNYWLYALKISTYGFMLEAAGFDIGGLGFTHTKADNKLYKVPYLHEDVKKVLELSLKEQA